ncbi:hypothetical protein GH714_019400 [Hevea brasiliensis]|uniref:Transposase-associated domain-containing protein n=1 Tax=Hevea brasiliensis TaxID=3981 RepID=A0A6A6L318_HEVBR|nr:hypothetical protein GH714_019400 [Hevea brasiliensis]
MMDRSWMLNKNKFSSEYIQGVRSFLDVAKQHVDSSGRIRCPCKNCNNCYLKKVAEVKQDLFLHGFVEDYTQWTHHGESFESDVGIHLGDSHDDDNLSDQVKDRHDNTFEMLKDMCNSNFTEFSAERPSSNHETTSSEKEVEKFARLLNDAQCELYPGCKKYSKLSFLIKMIYNKTITNSSNKSFSMNLELFKDALPEGETLPKSYYEVKKLMHDLGLGYITIDACVNDCILYWKEYEHLDTCLNPMCRAPRWKYGLGKCKKIAQKKSYPIMYDVPENEGIDNERFDFNDEPYQQYEINDGNVIEQIDNQDIESLHHDDEILEEIDATTILSRIAENQ